MFRNKNSNKQDETLILQDR